jgi:putative transposase
VPQTRNGNFATNIFCGYQRSKQAFVLALMEMVVQGVPTRKVNACPASAVVTQTG